MVETQAKNWVLRQKKPRDALTERWPVVTISCEFAAQGVAFGRGVAERLGFSYWDREIVGELAHLLHMGEGTVTVLDARTRSALEDLLGAFTPNPQVASAEYEAEVRRIVAAIARQGSAVIVGREAQFLVESCRALRVRLVAPVDFSVRQLEAESKISREAARRTIVAGEKEREAFILHALGKNTADSAHYDVGVNTATFAGERAEAVVLMAYFAKFGAWPLTAQALTGKPLAELARRLPPTDLMMNTV
jgi:cytidylate kinase